MKALMPLILALFAALLLGGCVPASDANASDPPKDDTVATSTAEADDKPTAEKDDTNTAEKASQTAEVAAKSKDDDDSDEEDDDSDEEDEDEDDEDGDEDDEDGDSDEDDEDSDEDDEDEGDEDEGDDTSDTGQQEGEASTKVTAVRVDRKAVETTVELPGRLEPYHRVKLGARVSGVLSELEVDIGDTFDEDDDLLELAVPDLEKEKDRVEASVEEARAAIQVHTEAVIIAKTRLSRLKEVAAGHSGFVPEQKLDDAKAEVGLARAHLALAHSHVETVEAELAEVETRLEFATLTAPFDGVVVKRLVDPGTMVQAGQPIIELAQVDTLRAVAFLPERSAMDLEDDAKVVLEFPGTRINPIETSVTRTSGVIDPDSQALRVEAHVDEQEGILPGADVRFQLVLQAREGVMVVPVEALHVAGKKGVLYAVREGTCVEVAVTTGADDGTVVEVLSGIEEEDRVVIATTGTLGDGRKCHLGD